MHDPWQSLLEQLWPSRGDPRASQARRIAFLQVCIAAAISVAAGPEIFAAIEMTALLEALGAILFLTALTAGVKLAAVRFWHAACDIALPASQIHVMHSNAAIFAKAQAWILCALQVVTWLSGFLLLGVLAHSIAHGTV